MNRRAFLCAAGGLSVSFLSGCALPVIPRRPSPSVSSARAWVRHHEGRYTLFLPRVEMGQNIATALKQVACTELGAAWDRVDVHLPATNDIDPVRATVGSDSVRDFAVPLAQACATLRDALAAGRSDGHIDARPYPVAELRAFRADAGLVSAPPALVQGEAIVRGAALFVADVRLPGMVFGRVLRAPASPELASRALGYDEAAARAEPGFVALVRDPLLRQGQSEGVGIVARTPGTLDRIERALAIRWHVDGEFSQATIDAALDLKPRLARGALAKSVHRDRVDRDGHWDVDVEIDVPAAAHGAIEPRAAVAQFGRDAQLKLWVGSQDVFYQRDVMARRLGLRGESIIVQGCRVGGAFGGKTICTVELEAAVLARATMQPVKVQWTRAQELRFGFHRPPSRHRLRARLEEGRLAHWWHAFSSSHILFTNAVVPPWLQRATDLIGDDGVARGAALPYRAAARRTEYDLVRLPVLSGPWRGLGAGPNALAIESAIDECARAARVDPLQFRITHAEEPRLARVLARVAEAARWEREAAAVAGTRRGRGVACGTYKGTSHAAVIAEVEVDAAGRLRVMRLTCAHDCGRVINADQVRAQCEGNLVWGLGMVMTDTLPVASSQVAAATFADAPIPRMGDVPSMEIVLVDHGDAPSGAGETAIVAAAGAIANAVRDATGRRLTRFPVTADDLRTLSS